MRVTIGERLGLLPKATKARPVLHTVEDVEMVQTKEKTIRLADCPSSSSVPAQPIVPVDCGGPARVRGYMEFIHKTAPVLIIEGRQTLSPEDYAAGRRR